MRLRTEWIAIALLAGGISAFGQNRKAPQQEEQTPATQAPAGDSAAAPVKAKGQGAGHDVGSGSADIGKGTAKGAGNVAEGAGKGAADLVTLHPINAAGAVGTGAAKGGKNIAVGAGKGTGKIVKGTGKALKKVF